MKAPADSTIKKLFAFSNNHCAFPDCKSAIVDRNTLTVTGKVCHIKAKSVLGPRYDESQTDEERHGFQNLILLCGEHHNIVDDKSQVDKFTVEILTGYKKKHEQTGNNELSQEDAKLARRLIDSYLQIEVDQSQTMAKSPGGIQAQATGEGGIAAAAGRDVKIKINYGDKKQSGRAKPPPDVVTEAQATQLSQLMKEVIELDSASPQGKKLSDGQLQQKWWGALNQKIPKTTYKNYSQAKFKRAMSWLRQQRGRLLAGVATEEPELTKAAAIRTIHTIITRSNRNKHEYYAELSERLGISPPFTSSTQLEPEDLQRVCGALRRDAKARGG
ncbi:MAG: hypothetical protein ABI042_02770 [Verrucomicrobiota bacterium]